MIKESITRYTEVAEDKINKEHVEVLISNDNCDKDIVIPVEITGECSKADGYNDNALTIAHVPASIADAN